MKINNKLVTEIKERLQNKFDYLSEDEVNVIFDMALTDYICIKYPSENNRPKAEDLQFNYYNTQWLYKRMVDILERAGGSNVTAYKENGLSYNYASSYIDDNLKAQLMPKAGVPR